MLQHPGPVVWNRISSKRLQDQEYATIDADSVTDCQALCRTEQQCVAVNFNDNTKRCALRSLSKLTSGTELFTVDGWDYYDFVRTTHGE